MSTDLSHALHRAVDGGGSDDLQVPFDIPALARRARRRRAARAGAYGTLGVATVGALVLGGVRLAGVDRASDVLPAAVPDAPLGTCGSAVPGQQTMDTSLGLSATTAIGSTDPELPLAVPATGAHLGTYARDQVWVTAWTSRPDDLSGVSTEESALSETLALVEELVRVRVAAQAAGAEVDVAEIADLESSIAAFREQGVTEPTDAPARLRVLLAYEGVVVGLTQYPAPDVLEAASTWLRTPSADVANKPFGVDLTTCSTAAQAGGAPLPAGTYQVYVARADDASATPTALAGPWTLTVPAAMTTVSGLPRQFPADVPLAPGRVITASTVYGGWDVLLATAGDDRLMRALDLLNAAPDSQEIALETTKAQVTLTGWTVDVEAVTTADGQTALYYQVRR